MFNKYNNETYRVDLFCKNCRKKSSVEIPRGVPIKEYCKGRECKNCGCSQLTVDISNELK